MCEGYATDYVTYTSALVLVTVNYHSCFYSGEMNYKNVKRHSIQNINLVAHQSDQTARGGGMKLLLVLYPGTVL
jgi:hypothetical protein